MCSGVCYYRSNFLLSSWVGRFQLVKSVVCMMRWELVTSLTCLWVFWMGASMIFILLWWCLRAVTGRSHPSAVMKLSRIMSWELIRRILQLSEYAECLRVNSRTLFSRFRISRSMRSVLITTKPGIPTRPSSSISALMKEKRVRIPFSTFYRLEDGLDTIDDELLKDEDVETGFAWHR